MVGITPRLFQNLPCLWVSPDLFGFFSSNNLVSWELKDKQFLSCNWAMRLNRICLPVEMILGSRSKAPQIIIQIFFTQLHLKKKRLSNEKMHFFIFNILLKIRDIISTFISMVRCSYDFLPVVQCFFVTETIINIPWQFVNRRKVKEPQPQGIHD